MQFIDNDLVTGSWDTTIMVITIPTPYCRYIAFGVSVCMGLQPSMCLSVNLSVIPAKSA